MKMSEYYQNNPSNAYAVNQYFRPEEAKKEEERAAAKAAKRAARAEA